MAEELDWAEPGTGAPALSFETPIDDDPQELYDEAPCGYLSTLPDGTIVRANRTFCTMTGYRREDLVGRKRFSDLLTGGGRIYHETHYAPLLRMEGQVRGIALDLVRSDGERIPVMVSAGLARDADERPHLIRTAVFDATHRREYERELLRAKRRAEESEERALVLAQTLQQTLIPHRPPNIRGLELSAVYRPAGDGSQVGGDFYDIFEIDSQTCVVAVGDVCGKGTEAAVVTALARHTIRAAAVRETEPSRMLTLLNDTLLNDARGTFCSVALVLLRRARRTWRATICSAGHPLPILSRAVGETEPCGSSGMVLGVAPNPPLVDQTMQIVADDLLLIFTDGVTEARRKDGMFGEERIRSCPDRYRRRPVELTHGLLQEVLAFQAGYARDDIVIVALRVES